MIKVIQGSDRRIRVKIRKTSQVSGVTGDPYNFTGVGEIRACFIKKNSAVLHLYYLGLTGDTTNGSDIIANLSSTANISEGDPVVGAGIPAGAKVLKTPTSTTSPTAANTIKISIAATATAAGVDLAVGWIEILDLVLGKIRIHLNETHTDSLESGTQGFEVKIKNGEDTEYVQFPESLEVVERLC